MELNGATPKENNIVWNAPSEIEQGIDNQIKKAVRVLNKEVRTKSDRTITPKYRNR